MTTVPDEPTDADPTQLEQAGAAIDEAKAAAGRVAKDESIDTGGDLPSQEQNVPRAPSPADSEGDSDDDNSDVEDDEASDEDSTDEEDDADS